MAGKAGLPSHRDQVPSSPHLHDEGALPQLFRGKSAFLQDESELSRGEKDSGLGFHKEGRLQLPAPSSSPAGAPQPHLGEPLLDTVGACSSKIDEFPVQ